MPTNPIAITVTGHAERSFAPNRCVVHLNIAFDGTTRAEAADASSKSAATLTQLIRSLDRTPARPVRRWSLDQIQHTRYRPYHPQGKKLPWNYRSTATGSVTFRDLGSVATFVDQASAIDGVGVGRLEWKLTRKSHAEAVSGVRGLAVHDALTKAEDYGRRLGCTRIEAVALADPGMLNAGQRPDVGQPVVRALAASAAEQVHEHEGLALKPERLRVTADVEARFEAY
ncbi:SIMPL domain-containing protein [Rhodococcus sp. NPDC049939]|uniref:SIMPL domain-containing protein n=1 Tax=Rhodococcus sp. NPDC049939 TaxID=3155511 RepID=UPI0033F70C9B